MLSRLRDSLIRDNKVIPGVLIVLALLVFFWVFAGFFWGSLVGGPDDEQVSNRAFMSQSPELAQQSGGASASPSPAPALENRNAESYAAYQSKDPFRELIPSADSASAPSTTADGTTTGEGTSNSASPTPIEDGGGGNGGGGASQDQYDGGQGGGGSGGGQGGGSGGGGQGGGGQGGGGQGGGSGGGGQGEGGDLFDSGGSLPY